MEDYYVINHIRQEYFYLLYRIFVILFSKYGKINVETKSAKVCREKGVLEGLSGIFSRIINIIHLYSEKNYDPVIPYLSHKNINFDEILNELIEYKISPKDSFNIINTIIEFSNKFSHECFNIKNYLYKKDNGKIYKFITENYILYFYEPNSVIIEKYILPIRNTEKIPKNKYYGFLNIPLYSLKTKEVKEYNKNYFTSCIMIKKSHYSKLINMYNEKMEDSVFDERVYNMIATYEIFFGNTSGLQGSLTYNTFNLLEKNYEVSCECFASPLNCYFKKYYSMFYHVDKFFGSFGNFFNNFDEKEGTYEANPPFINHIIELMIIKIIFLLNTNKKFTFIIILPYWEDSNFFNVLDNSEYKISKVILNKKEHSYIDGLQHRADRYSWNANVNSVCFVVSNKKIKKLKNTKLLKDILSK